MPGTTFLRLAASALLVSIAAAGPASAEAVYLGKFGDWLAYAEGTGAKKTCYMGSSPTKSDGKYAQRGRAYFLVSHLPGEKERIVGQVSVEAGYPFKERSTATLSVADKGSFSLFTKGENAWASDDKADRKIVETLKAGKQMTIKGTSARGTETTDRYSLTGFTAGYEAISKACGVT